MQLACAVQPSGRRMLRQPNRSSNFRKIETHRFPLPRGPRPVRVNKTGRRRVLYGGGPMRGGQAAVLGAYGTNPRSAAFEAALFGAVPEKSCPTAAGSSEQSYS